METKNLKIIAIDDNQDNLITIKALILEAFPDASIYTATSGEKGIELAHSKNPDVILLDIIMPEMDGFAVCERLKADQNVCDIPVVFITALKGDKESRIKALEVGAEAFLSKPIDESELAAQIRAMAKIRALHIQKQSTETKLVTMVEEKTRELKENHLATLNLLEDLKSENEARKISEEALFESELKFRTLMDNSPEGITIYAEGKIVYVNKETIRMMGATDENQLLGTTITDFIHPDNQELILERMKLVAMAPLNAILPSVEEKYVRLDGSEFDVEIKVMPILYEGKPAIQLSGHNITDRKIAERRLNESEEKYRLMFNNNPQPMFIYDLDTLQFIEVNLSAIEHYGYTRDEFLTMSLLDIRPKEDIQPFVKHIKVVKDNVTTRNLEWRHLKKNGEIIYVEATATSLFSSNRKERHVLINDITARKLAEQKLLDSEVKYREMFANNPQPMLIYDLETLAFLEVNQACINHYGYSREEFLNLKIQDIRPPEDMPALMEEISEIRNSGVAKTSEWHHIKKNGEVINVELTAVNVNNNGREARHVMITDITQRKQAEEKLRASEDKYRTIIENSNDLIWMLDAEGNFTYINDQATLSTGVRLDEWKGKSFVPHVFAVDLPTIDNIFHRTLAGESCKYQLRLRKNDNDIMYLSVNSSPIFVNAKVEGIINFGRDITARKQIEAELERNRQELKAIYDNAPVMMCLIDEETKILFGNKAFEYLSSAIDTDINGQQVGNAIGCLKSFKNGCGKSILCKDCSLRNAIIDTLETGLGHSNIEHKTRVIHSGEQKEISLLASTAIIDKGEHKSILLCLHDITEMKRAEENLKELGDSYFGLFNTVQHSIFIQNLDMSFVDVNQGAVDMCGYDKEYMIGKKPTIIAAGGLNNFTELDNYIELALAGIPQQYEFWGKHKDGSIFPMEVWTLKGKYFGKDVLITLANDISERKATELVLKENESRLNIMFEFSPVAIWEEDFSEVKNYIDTLKLQGVEDLNSYFDLHPEAIHNVIALIKVLAINNKNNEIFGTTSTDEILQNIKHYFYSNDLTINAFKNEIVALSNGESSFECETQVINQQGELRYLYLNLIVIPGFETSLSKVLVSFIDITERKIAEEALQKSEMFLRTFIENTPFEIWARDTNNVGILENKKMVEHFGSILGKTPDNKADDKNVLELWKSNNKRVFAGEVIDEETIYKYNGKNYTYQQIIFPISNNKNIIGIAGFNIDISERKRAEEALKNSQEQLKNFSAHLQTIREEEKIALAREIHDDLGQILVALKIDMGMLKQKVAKTIPSSMPNDTQSSIEDMMKLIENTIRTTRRIMNGLRPEQLEILGFVDAVKLYLSEFQDRHAIKCSLESNVSKVELSAQKTLALFRILQESMTNVARHSKATKVKLKIKVENDNLKFSISDNGDGFDMSKKAKMTSYGMIGMHERVTLVDGKLNVKSNPGKGTTITVEIATLNS